MPIVNVPTGICALKHLIQLAHSVRMITSKGARNLLKDVQFPGIWGTFRFTVSVVTAHVHLGDVDNTYPIAISQQRRRVSSRILLCTEGDCPLETGIGAMWQCRW